jgi:hypothetical protein
MRSDDGFFWTELCLGGWWEGGGDDDGGKNYVLNHIRHDLLQVALMDLDKFQPFSFCLSSNMQSIPIVADFFQSTMSNRSYRPEWSPTASSDPQHLPDSELTEGEPSFICPSERDIVSFSIRIKD